MSDTPSQTRQGSASSHRRSGDPTTARRRPGISALIVEGYKSLVGYTRLETRYLTLLAGSNSSGKSSAIQPLLLLKQTLEAGYDPGPLLIDGPNVTFTELRQMLAISAKSNTTRKLSVGMEVHGDQVVVADYAASSSGAIQLLVMRFGDPTGPLSVMREGMRGDTVRRILPEPVREGLDSLAKPMQERGRRTVIRVTRDRCFLAVELGQARTRDHRRDRLTFGVSPAGPAVAHVLDTIHVPAVRGNPQRLYRKSAVGNRYPGRFEEYVASIIAAWQSEKDARLATLGDQLRALGLSWGVAAVPVSDTQVELRVGRLPERSGTNGQDMVSIADVGFGVSQVLPVIVALLVASPEDLVYIEEPEIHLHPRAQYLLSRLLADAVRRGVQVIAETHSSLLLRGLQVCVANGSVHPDDVILHWFDRSPVSGQTSITSAGLDSKGRFGSWPVDFDDVTLWAED